MAPGGHREVRAPASCSAREDAGQFASRDVLPLNLMMLLPDYSLPRHFSRYAEC